MSIVAKDKRKSLDAKYFKTFPGIFVALQLICCSFGFLLSIAAPHAKRGGHVFFVLTMAVACFAGTLWTVMHLCEVKSSSRFRNWNWNKVGLIYSGVLCFLSMVGSSCMIEVAYGVRTLRAAGVFGFLGFVAFLAHFCCEIKRFKETAMPTTAVCKGSISQGHQKETSPAPNNDDNEDSFEPVVDGTFKALPSNTYTLNQQPEGEAETNYVLTVNKEANYDSFDSDDSSEDNTKNTYNFKS